MIPAPNSHPSLALAQQTHLVGWLKDVSELRIKDSAWALIQDHDALRRLVSGVGLRVVRPEGFKGWVIKR